MRVRPSEISVFMKETPECTHSPSHSLPSCSSPSFNHGRVQGKMDSFQTKRGLSPELDHAGPLISGSQP